MPRQMPTCEYEHDVSGSQFDDDVDAWSCPHPVEGGEDFCVFHVGLSDDGPPDTIDFGAAIKRAVEAEESERNRLLGAVVDDVNLDSAVLDGDTNHPIDLREARILGELRATDAEIRQELNCDGTHFEGPVVAEGINFQYDVTFGNATFHDLADFKSATFGAWAGFDDCTFERMANVRLARFEMGLSAMDAEFCGGFDAMSAVFDQVVNVKKSVFDAGALFNSAELTDLSLDNAIFGETVAIGRDKRDNPTLSEGENDLTQDELSGYSLLATGVRCGDVSLSDATVPCNISLREAKVEGDINFNGIQTAGSGLEIDLRKVTVVSGEFPLRAGVQYRLGEATLGPVQLKEVGDEVSVDQLQLGQVEYAGFDFGQHKELFQQERWNLFTNSNEPPATKENSYMRAKNGAIETGDSNAAGEFHFRELSNRGLSYRQRAADAETRREQAHFLWRWVSNRALKYTCGYGERSSYVIISSVVLVFVYAVVYSLFSIPTSYQGVFGSLVLSFDAFNALALGLPSVEDPMVGVLVTSEAFLGPFFIALFVFTITQSIGR